MRLRDRAWSKISTCSPDIVHVLIACIIHVLLLARVLHQSAMVNHPFPYCSSQCVLSSPLSWQHTCPSPYSRRHSQTSLVVTRTLRAFLLSFSTHASSPHSTASMVLPFSPPQMTPSTDTSNFCLSGHLFLTMMDLQSPTMYGSNSASSFSTIF